MKRFVQITLSIVIAVVLLWWIFSRMEFSWADLSKALLTADPGWILVMLGAAFASFVTRIFRWGYIVRTGGAASFRDMFSATQIGFLVNFSLPFRLGEFARAVALNRLTRMPISKCIAFCALDRITDLFGLVAVTVVAVSALRDMGEIVVPAALIPGMQKDVAISGTLVRALAFKAEIALAVGIVLLVLLYLNKLLVVRFTRATLGRVLPGLAERLVRMFENFADGLHVFRTPVDMLKSLAWSFATWGLFVVGIYSLIHAFGLKTPWYTVFVMQTLLALIISLPVTPGILGQFQLPIIASILMFVPGATQADAMAVSLMAYAINIGTVYLAGFGCLLLERRRLFAPAPARVPSELPAEAGE